jgi:hypothetical protein
MMLSHKPKVGNILFIITLFYMSVYDVNAISERKQYAKRCILNGNTNSRAFDACFEMGDGDAVMLYLWKQAERNSFLRMKLGIPNVTNHWYGTRNLYEIYLLQKKQRMDKAEKKRIYLRMKGICTICMKRAADKEHDNGLCKQCIADLPF